MKKTRRAAVVAAILALAITGLLAQTTQKPSFDVVSVKPSPPLGNGPNRIGGGAQGDRFTMNNATLRMLLQVAYQPTANAALFFAQMEIIGGPSWMESDRFDVQAKTDCSGGKIPREKLQLMVQSLLEDRFKLKAHLETRELPVYNLVVAKDGPKIKKSADQTPPAIAAGLPGPCEPAPADAPPPFAGRGAPFAPGTPPPRGAVMMMMGASGLTIRATASPLAVVVRMLQQQLGRTVVDNTRLESRQGFHL